MTNSTQCNECHHEWIHASWCHNSKKLKGRITD